MLSIWNYEGDYQKVQVKKVKVAALGVKRWETGPRTAFDKKDICNI